MGIVIFISAIIAGLVFKKSKICTFYIFSIMYIYSAFRSFDADYNTYKIGYDYLGSDSSFRYAGYTSFEKIFFDKGFNFQQYNYFFYAIVFILVLISIRLLTENVNIVLSLYLIYSYALDVVQMKSAISEAFSLIAISIVIKLTYKKWEGDKRTRIFSWIFALLLLVIAMYMHFSSAFYLFAIFIYLVLRNRENVGKRIFILMIISFGLMFSGFIAIIMRFANVLGIIDGMDYLNYWTEKATRLGFLIYFALVALVILSCRYNKSECLFDKEQEAISDFMLTAMLALPFLYLNGNYSRILRIYMVLMYTFFGRMKRSKIISGKKLLNNVLLSCSLALFYYLDIGTNFTNTLGAILSSNLLIK